MTFNFSGTEPYEILRLTPMKYVGLRTEVILQALKRIRTTPVFRDMLILEYGMQFTLTGVILIVNRTAEKNGRQHS